MFVLLLIFVSLKDAVTGYYLADLILPSESVEETETYAYDKCLSMKKILFENQCWDLLTRGPCDEGHWLVLDWSADDGDQRRPVRARCTKRRCSESDVYWPWDGFCYDTEMARRDRLCPHPDTELVTDEYGDGYCECRGAGTVPYVRLASADDGNNENAQPCYPLYTRGPCPWGHVLTPFGWGYGNCTEDTCVIAERRRTETPPPRRRSRQPHHTQRRPPQPSAVHAPWTDGRCYELGSRGPCSGNEQFAVVRELMRPGCVSPVTVLDLFSSKKSTTTAAPCYTNHRGECVDAIQIQMSNDTSNGFMEQLRESARRHSERNKRKTKRTP